MGERTKRVRLTKKRLAEFGEMAEARLRYWQEVLGLRDWKITLLLTREPVDGSVAATEYVVTLREGKVHVWVDAFFGGADWEVDLDTTLVHELLHLWVGTILSPDEQEERLVQVETMINAIAKGFVALGNRAEE